MPPSASPTPSRFAALLPVLMAAVAFAVADVTTKMTFNDGADVLTQALVRGLLGVPLMAAWLLVGVRPAALKPAELKLTLFVGVLFAGNVFLLFKAIEAMAVPVAILTYFTYPLLTGLAAALTGMERLGVAGALPAMVAFAGLALTIGASPGGIAVLGVAFGLMASATRVVILLITRAKLHGADARLFSIWSLAAATAVFALAALFLWNWQPPASAIGWTALIGGSVAMAIAVLGVFVSTMRIGPFRTALFMNLEPLLATVGSAVVLGEVVTPLQAVGGALMIAALVAFQLRR